MSGFTRTTLEKKLGELNSSQQSIQTLSFWLIHHRKHFKIVVQTWYRELKKAKVVRRLSFMYLSNDVIQNSRKKGPEYTKEFATVLSKAFHHVALNSEDKTKKGLSRLINVWEERSIFTDKNIKDFKTSLANASKHVESTKPAKAPKEEKIEESIKIPMAIEPSLLVTLKEELVTGSPKPPPEPEDLIKALQDLENSASTDAAVREKIASLPPEVSDISSLSNLSDKGHAKKLEVLVNEASSVLNDYNTRLTSELDDRKKVSQMLSDFVRSQREKLSESETQLEEFKEKLERVTKVRDELKFHIQSLPDLTRLPDVTGGLAPLPSAGDLFSLHK